MATKYLYFNKTTYRHLVKLWLRFGNGEKHSFSSNDEYIDYLMECYIPEKFICDIERSILL